MLTFHHAPFSRSSSIRWLIEELEIPHEIAHVDIRATDTGAPEAYRAVQAHKKVPAIVHDGVVVTERAAIAIYLCDAFSNAALAPPIGDPRRGPHLSWLVYADSVLDPCLAAKLLGWAPKPSTVSFGSFEDMVANLERTLSERPYILGDTFTAADTQIASGLHWATHAQKGLLPRSPTFRDYVTRTTSRPAFQRVMEKDQADAKAIESARGKSAQPEREAR